MREEYSVCSKGVWRHEGFGRLAAGAEAFEAGIVGVLRCKV